MLLIDLLSSARTLPAEDEAWDHPGLRAARDAGYAVYEKLAVGGEGEVWLGGDRASSDLVAIKVAKPRANAAELDDEVVAHETRALRSLRHQSVVQYLDSGDTPGQRFLVLRYLDGEHLFDALDEHPYWDLLELLRTLVEGVAWVHTAGFVHGDIKPENIVVTYDGQPTLIDFGLSRRDTDSRGLLPQLTAKLRGGGTFGYVAPELQTNRQTSLPTKRSDVFSLATVLSESLDRAGQAGRWRGVLRRGLLAAPERRYADAVEMLAAINAVEKHRRWRSRRVLIGFSISLATAAAIGTQLTQTQTPGSAAASLNLVDLYGEVIQNLDRGDGSALARKLTAVPALQRDWTWRFVDQLIQDRGIVYPFKRFVEWDPTVTTLTVSGDGERVAWSEEHADSYVISVSDVQDHVKPIAVLRSRPRGLDLSNAGDWLAIRHADRAVELIHLDDPAWRVHSPPGVVARGIGFDRRGNYRYLDTDSGELSALSVIDGKQFSLTDVRIGIVLAVAATGHGDPLLLRPAEDEPQPNLMYLASGGPAVMLPETALQHVTITSVTASETGKLFATSADGKIWAGHPGPDAKFEPLWQAADTPQFTALCYAEQEGLIFAAANVIHVIHAATGEELARLPWTRQRDVVRALSWDPETRSLRIIGGSTIQSWNASRDHEIAIH